jgi:hypothetical protein
MIQNEIKTDNSIGKKAKGRGELAKHLDGKRLTLKEAVLANCYGCMGGYTDGLHDCEIPDCPLYAFMPYRENKREVENHV